MDKSDVEETVVTLYLRLNGYFVSGFIVHAKDRTTTELDVLAVRFPRHQEAEREIQCDPVIAIPERRIDFIVGEVKGGAGAVNFNARFRENPAAIRAVLGRFGAFDEDEISEVENRVPTLLDPARLQKASGFPSIDIHTSATFGSCDATLRLMPFAVGQQRPARHARSYIFSDDMLNFVWQCFRPEQRRERCDTRYNYELWGPQFVDLVHYFKDPARQTPGSVEEMYRAMHVA